MKIELREGRPTIGGAPAAVTARQWEPVESRAAARALARDWADEGWHAIWLAGAPDDDLRDAAWRAGLTIVCGAGDSDPGLLVASDLAPGVLAVAETVESAWSAWFDGARVVVGDAAVVEGLRQLLELVPGAVTFEPAPPQGAWRLAGQAGELLGYVAAGEPVEFVVPAREPAWAVHWLLPATGLVEGLETPEPSERHRLQPWPRHPCAFYLGPSVAVEPLALTETLPPD